MSMLDDGYDQGYFDASMEKDILIRKAREKAIDDVLEIIDKYTETPSKMELTSWQDGWLDGLAFIRERVCALNNGK